MKTLLTVLALLVAAPAAAQTPWYRPLSLGDMVDAVGTNPEGMPEDLLGDQVSTYALHIGGGRGVGVSARFTADPDGAILVAWRAPDRLWTWGWIEDDRLGRLEAFRLVNDTFVVTTRQSDRSVTSAVLDREFEVRAVVAGEVEATVTQGQTLTITVTTDTRRRVLTCGADGACTGGP